MHDPRPSLERSLLADLQAWQKKPGRLPLLLRGARQVGKTHLVEHWGQTAFSDVVSINFEQSPQYAACFKTLVPSEIVGNIEVLAGRRIIPGQTLLFLDEVQECPRAMVALRYFKEQMPELHVIGAGSLLEFALQSEDLSVPVGRVQYLYLRPLSFLEFLYALGDVPLIEKLRLASLEHPPSSVVHEHALRRVQEYMMLGGMPAVLTEYLSHHSWIECQKIQSSLLQTYRDDFSKYRSMARHKYLQKVYERAVAMVGQQVKYSHIASEMDSRYLKEAIADLSRAGVIYPVYRTSALGLPLGTYRDEKKFKMLFLDMGLMRRASKMDVDVMLSERAILLDRGALAEQYVGQELLAYAPSFEEAELYYWSRDAKNSCAEVDFLMPCGSTIVPIEVKSGKTGRLKSLHLLLEERGLPLGVRISEKPLEQHGPILSVPFYMIHQLSRLVREAQPH